MAKRGPKPRPLLERIQEKIVIEGLDTFDLALLKGQQEWPEAYLQPWYWTGHLKQPTRYFSSYRASDGIRTPKVQMKVIQPRLKVESKYHPVHRLLYQELMGPIPPRSSLKRLHSDPRNVNPRAFELRTYQGVELNDPVPESEPIVVPDAPVSVSQDVEELAQMIQFKMPFFEEDYTHEEIAQAKELAAQ
jgi:hypothetical protein